MKQKPSKLFDESIKRHVDAKKNMTLIKNTGNIKVKLKQSYMKI